MLLSIATRRGIKLNTMQIILCIEILCILAVQAFVEMAKVLLSLPGVSCILSEKLCQDPLEFFF